MKKLPQSRYLGLESMQTIAEYLVTLLNKHQRQTAIESTQGNISFSRSYGQLMDSIYACHCYFADRGIIGKRVALLGDVCYEWLVVFFTLLIEGQTAILIPDEMETVEINIKKADVDVLFYSECLSNTVDKLDLHMAFCTYSYLGQKIADYPQDGCALDYCRDGDVCAVVAFTSGTSGRSKLVMLSQQNLLHDCIAHIRLLPFEDDERVILALPVFHMYSITAGILIPIFFGATICIGGGAKTLLRDLLQFRPTVLIVVPMILEVLVKRIQSEIRRQGEEQWMKATIRFSRCCLKFGIDMRQSLFSHLREPLGGAIRNFSVGGAAIAPEIIQFLTDIGIPTFEGYGITECSPVIATNGPVKYRLGSVGTIPEQPYYQVKILNGEICVKGSIVMQGYYHDLEEFKKSVVDGWFHTGDCGKFDKDGFLYVTGRKKNQIILSDGNNVDPEELEMSIYQCPFVQTVLVNAQWDGGRQLICAEIFINRDACVEKDQIIVEDEVRAFIKAMNRKAPGYKQIRKIHFLDCDLPKTRLGKVKRHLES